MKRLLFNMGLMIFLVAATLFFVYRWVNYPSFQLSALLDKHRRLDSLVGLGQRKIIIVGGSNCLFGFNSAEIEDHFQRPVANLGLHAGLGLKFILNDCLEFVGRGDVVVLSPEYNGFIGKTCDGESALDEVIYGVYPAGIRKLEPNQYWHFAANTGQYVQDLLQRPVNTLPFLQKFYGSDSRRIMEIASFIDKRHSVDSLGDIIVPPALDTLVHANMEPVAGDINGDAIRLVRRFRDSVTARGAILVLLPQSLSQKTFDVSRNKIRELDSLLERAGVPFHAAGERYAFDDRYIFNTDSHLNGSGREIRTRRVIEDLEGLIPR